MFTKYVEQHNRKNPNNRIERSEMNKGGYDYFAQQHITNQVSKKVGFEITDMEAAKKTR